MFLMSVRIVSRWIGGQRGASTISMTRTVNVSVVSVRCLIFNVSRVNRDTTGLFLRCFVNLVVIGKFGASCSGQNLCNGGGQRCFTMIDVAWRNSESE